VLQCRIVAVTFSQSADRIKEAGVARRTRFLPKKHSTSLPVQESDAPDRVGSLVAPIVTPSSAWYNLQYAESDDPDLRERICGTFFKETLGEAKPQALRDAGRTLGLLQSQSYRR
jgi:hypothetical protein